jgi:hypothetical protein
MKKHNPTRDELKRMYNQCKNIKLEYHYMFYSKIGLKSSSYKVRNNCLSINKMKYIISKMKKIPFETIHEFDKRICKESL